MIKDNSLEERLNAVKEGKPIPKPYRQDNYIVNDNNEDSITLIDIIISEIRELTKIVVSSILYGYGISAIISKDWNFIKTFGIGLIFFNLLNKIGMIILKSIKKDAC